MRKLLLAALAATLGFLPLAAAAQEGPPSYAQGSADDAQIRGRITSFDGAYSVQVRDDKGYIDNVQLHQGTIINPTGITLAPGMVVSILGYNAGSYFAANEVDTPYTYYGGVPYYGGHPWYYYGPSISLGFFFGNGGWWHASAFGGPYHYVNGYRVYNNVTVRNVYRNGGFNGRRYIASPQHGGYVPHGTRTPSGGPHGGGDHRR